MISEENALWDLNLKADSSTEYNEFTTQDKAKGFCEAKTQDIHCSAILGHHS